jgi:hypothetical protein
MLRFPKRRAPGLTVRYLFFNTLQELVFFVLTYAPPYIRNQILKERIAG